MGQSGYGVVGCSIVWEHGYRRPCLQRFALYCGGWPAGPCRRTAEIPQIILFLHNYTKVRNENCFKGYWVKPLQTDPCRAWGLTWEAAGAAAAGLESAEEALVATGKASNTNTTRALKWGGPLQNNDNTGRGAWVMDLQLQKGTQ